MKKQSAIGYLIGAVAAAAYGCNPLFGVQLYGQGLEPTAVLFLRFSGATILMGAILVCARRTIRLEDHQLFPVLGMGMLQACSSIALFEAYLYMDAGIASSLLFVYPLLVALLNALIFGERIRRAARISLLLAIIGIAMLYTPSPSPQAQATGAPAAQSELLVTREVTPSTATSPHHAPHGFPIGFMLVMLSALTYACMLVGVNQEPVSEVSSETLVFCMMLVGAGMFGLMLAPSGRIPLPRNALGWGSVAGIVLLPSILSFFGTAWAIRLVGSTPVAIIGALEPVTAVALGMLFLRERPTPLNFAGIALILAAVVLVVLRGTPRGAK